MAHLLAMVIERWQPTTATVAAAVDSRANSSGNRGTIVNAFIFAFESSITGSNHCMYRTVLELAGPL